MVFACFYLNPSLVGTGPGELRTVSTATAFFVEAVLTMFLLLAFLLTPMGGIRACPGFNLTPLLIGLAVTAIVGIGAPLTMAVVNPV